ncbi:MULTISPECIES: glycolate oxidase subunit GlcE [unclassified Aureimonas]|uniref:glycolate oxidase subunit GlcE n=1 Tax=unclassified Aureimonas TaxID=2615206 RepID=UPI0007009C44|nr:MULTISPECIES: glycolate oxidase subunit GlcE [unclassified Aureimonas]KQT69759.1 2-hydroxy-acid oxidase [Aureimonas sp. Leaf427]KQT76089.1 2-hydroxy-acid oxidase [Aureimonas sp. Leaf460]
MSLAIDTSDRTVLVPQSVEEVREIVAAAVSQREPLAIEGTGSKRGLGRPVQAARTLSLAGLSGVTLYEPDELVLSARAGTPIAEIERLVDEAGQRLEFEPLDYGPLFGMARGQGTLGGVLACNLSGPRRLKQGAARDHVLGVAAVSGRAEVFKAGGRVVKNVTGYDLSKGLTGSFGTLAVLTDATIKVLPKAETETTLVLRGLDDAAAAGAMAAAMGSSAEVSGAAHLPRYVASRVAAGALGAEAATCLRLEGFGPSVAARAAHLGPALARVGWLEVLEREASRALWRDIRDVVPFADGTDRPVWRLSVAPTRGPDVVLALRMAMAVDAFYDWQGGLVWLRLEGEPEAELVRAAVERHGGGHAMLVRASDAVRAATPVFQPQPAALAALAGRLKDQFDPAGVLNPGRMG